LIRRFLAFVLRPLFKALIRIVPVDDPWERLNGRVPLPQFGSGARHDFRWYLEGETAQAPSSLEEIMEWLGGCEYESDEAMFAEPDFWQHPRTFEHLRRGDCEDFALWAWRNLLRLGYDADLVVGRCLPPARKGSRHAWIVFRRDGKTFLYEPSQRARQDAIRPLEEVRDRYIPEFGVGRDARPFAYSGYLYILKHPDLVGHAGASAIGGS
jgi:hypothetical protein